MSPALDYSGRVAKEADKLSVKASAQEREFICEVPCILYTPFAPLTLVELVRLSFVRE